MLAGSEYHQRAIVRFETGIVGSRVINLCIPRPHFDHPVSVVKDGLVARACRRRRTTLPVGVGRCAGDKRYCAIHLGSVVALDISAAPQLYRVAACIGTPHVPRVRRILSFQRREDNLHAHVRGGDVTGIDDLRAVAFQVRVRHVTDTARRPVRIRPDGNSNHKECH